MSVESRHGESGQRVVYESPRSGVSVKKSEKDAQVQFGSVRSFVLVVAEGEAAEEEEEAAVVEVADEMAVLVKAGAVVVEFEIVVETLVEEGTTEAVALRVAEGVTDGVIVCRIRRDVSSLRMETDHGGDKKPYNILWDIHSESCAGRTSDATAVLERVAAASQAARAGSERSRSRVERVGAPAFFREGPDLLGQRRRTASM